MNLDVLIVVFDIGSTSLGRKGAVTLEAALKGETHISAHVLPPYS